MEPPTDAGATDAPKGKESKPQSESTEQEVETEDAVETSLQDDKATKKDTTQVEGVDQEKPIDDTEGVHDEKEETSPQEDQAEAPVKANQDSSPVEVGTGQAPVVAEKDTSPLDEVEHESECPDNKDAEIEESADAEKEAPPGREEGSKVETTMDTEKEAPSGEEEGSNVEAPGKEEVDSNPEKASETEDAVENDVENNGVPSKTPEASAAEESTENATEELEADQESAGVATEAADKETEAEGFATEGNKKSEEEVDIEASKTSGASDTEGKSKKKKGTSRKSKGKGEPEDQSSSKSNSGGKSPGSSKKSESSTTPQEKSNPWFFGRFLKGTPFASSGDEDVQEKKSSQQENDAEVQNESSAEMHDMMGTYMQQSFAVQQAMRETDADLNKNSLVAGSTETPGYEKKLEDVPEDKQVAAASDEAYEAELNELMNKSLGKMNSDDSVSTNQSQWNDESVSSQTSSVRRRKQMTEARAQWESGMTHQSEDSFAVGDLESGDFVPKHNTSDKVRKDADYHVMAFKKSFSFNTLKDKDDLSSGKDDAENIYRQKAYMLSNPWFPSVILTAFFVAPILIVQILAFHDLVGRMWAISACASHLFVSIIGGICVLGLYEPGEPGDSIIFSSYSHMFLTLFTSGICWLDIFLFWRVYPQEIRNLDDNFFSDIDGTYISEYEWHAKMLHAAVALGSFVASCRLCLGIAFWLSILLTRLDVKVWSQYPNSMGWPSFHIFTVDGIRRVAWILMWIYLLVSVVFFGWSTYSRVDYYERFGMNYRRPPGPECDPVDFAECMLPFPSYHYMMKSPVSSTGYIMNITKSLLPRLTARFRQNAEMSFLNRADGFSTSAPMMFYLHGLKESVEGMRDNPLKTTLLPTEMATAENIDLSVSSRSMTLLLDVDSRKLVPHWAEIDYYDDERPMALLYPAQPLKHGTHYAVALVNVTNFTSGERFLPTYGFQDLMDCRDKPGDRFCDSDRRDRYNNTVIPALEEAAPWVSYRNDPMGLQMMFDFPTVSAQNQLQPIRLVRNTTFDYIRSRTWKWEEHVRVVNMKDYNCLRKDRIIARSIDAEVDVPWFLDRHGSGNRGAFLDDIVVERGLPRRLGTFKFSFQIPCSIWAGIVPERANGKVPVQQINAVMDYGHGLFGDRGEAEDEYVQQLANDEGYIIMAMDFRGMTRSDLPTLLKSLVSNSELFRSTRDNLIQGYAARIVMNRFAREGLWRTDWVSFRGVQGIVEPGLIEPAYVFYGNSMGGLLGAGYVSLVGTLGIVDRAVITNAGLTLSEMILRSMALKGIDSHLLYNFQYKRLVHMSTVLLQMTWDSVEGGGLLAEPVTERRPDVLLQTGLGDSIMRGGAGESLARGFHARLLPNRPKDVYGLETSMEPLPRGHLKGDAALTEFLYKVRQTTVNAVDGGALNKETLVHDCMKYDPAAIFQLKTFITTGQVVDVCKNDQCIRDSLSCPPGYRSSFTPLSEFSSTS